jgi:hypothetical protein
VAVETETGVVDPVRQTETAEGEIDIPGLLFLPEIENPDGVETTIAPNAHPLLGAAGGADPPITMMADAGAGLGRLTIATAVHATPVVKTMTTCHCRGAPRWMSQTFKSLCWTILIGG